MDKEQVRSELKWKAVRSSGPGGQHVNKVASKVVLGFDVANSLGLTQDEKLLLQSKIATKLTQESVLIITCDEERSQFKNKEIALKKCFKIIDNGLKIPKIRTETKIPRRVKEKRLHAKKVMSILKQQRQKPNF